MKLFIDTANIEDIRTANKWGVICGVTTNPTLIAKEGRDVKEVIEEIASIVDGPISGEVNALDTDGMISEGRILAGIHPQIVVKIPMCQAGLEAVSVLSKEGIKSNVTLIFTPAQALLAARAGASFVSPFVGRLEDIDSNGINLIEQIAIIFQSFQIKAEIIAASIRSPQHISECALAGADIATVPFKVLDKCFEHPLTSAGIEQFKKDYDSMAK
jgi:transaldolase